MEDNASRHKHLRLRIVEVASQAFRAEGIKSVTMDEIAHRLSISKRTLYQVFRDKEELLMACFEARRQHEKDFLDGIMAKTDNVMEVLLSAFAHKMEDLGQVSPAYLPDLRKYPRLVEVCDSYARLEEADSIAFMERGIAQGIFRPDVDFKIVFPLLRGLMGFAMEEPRFRDCRLVDIFCNSAMVIVRGCATTKGIAMIDEFFQKFGDAYRD